MEGGRDKERERERGRSPLLPGLVDLDTHAPLEPEDGKASLLGSAGVACADSDGFAELQDPCDREDASEAELLPGPALTPRSAPTCLYTTASVMSSGGQMDFIPTSPPIRVDRAVMPMP